MVVPINNVANESKPKENITITYSGNSGKVENSLVNPDFGKVINRGSDTNYNITVNYSTDLTHPELAPNGPVQNPVLERIKTLSPVQEITIVGRGTDPEVIANHPTKINPYTKEQPTETQTTTQSTNLTPQDVLGPIMNRYLNYDPNYFANQVLQITNGLTLPELFQILGQDPKFWAPSYSSSSFPNGSSINVANVEISGNKITFSNQSQLNESWSNGGSYNSQVVNTLTVEPYTVTQNGKTYHLILVKQQQYNYEETVNPHSNPDVYQSTLTTYYLINPTTKQVIYKAQEPPQQSQYWLPSQQSGNIVQPSQTISNVLQQYGYQLTQQELQEIDNLQKGQSIKIGNLNQTPIVVTYLGNNQYNLESLGEFYTSNGQEIAINETVTVPTYSINQNGQINTTNLSISGNIYSIEGGRYKPFYTETYNVNETIPINYGYNTQTGQLTFWSGNPQGGINLQNISLPTLTYQQYIELANGQIPPGIKPGWYYYPTLNEIVYINTQTIQQPQINWNQLWFGYSYQPIPTSTNTTTKQQPQILRYSFSSSQLLSDIWNGLTTLGQDVYNWFTGLFSSKGSTISSNNITNTNFELGGNIYQTSQYISGVLAPPVQLSGKQAYQAELQNVIFESQQIEQEVNNNQAYGGPTWLGINVYGSLAQAFAGLGLVQPAQFFLNLEQQALSAGTPANILANVFGLGQILGSIAMVEYSVPEEISGSVGTNVLNFIRTQLTPLNFAKNYALTTVPNLIFSNLINYQLTGQPLSLQQNLELAAESIPFTFVYSGINGYYESMANPILESIGIGSETPAKLAVASRVLYSGGSNFVAGTGANLAMQAFSSALGWQNGINWNEALFSGLFSGGVTLGIEGFRAFRNPGSYVASFGYYPQEETVTTLSPSIRNGNSIKVKITGKGLVTEAYPKIGGRIITKEDFSNIEPKEYPFGISGNIQLKKASAVGFPLDEFDNAWIIKLLNEKGQTYYAYEGNIETSTEGGSLLSDIWGIFKTQRTSEIKDFGNYKDLVKTEQSTLEESYPEYEELRNVPTEGIYLFQNVLTNRYVPLVENVNEGQTLLEAGVSAYFDRFANLAGSRYVSLVTTSSDLANRGILTLDEAQALLETSTKQYSNLISELSNAKQQIFNEISNGLPNLEVTNLEGLYPYITPEDLNINTGKLPNPYFLKGSSFRSNIYNIDLIGTRTGNVELGMQSSEFDLNKGFNKGLLVGDISIIETSSGKTYRTIGEGIIGSNNEYSIGTMFQIIKNNEGETWYIEQQSGSIPLSNRASQTFSYLKGVDPNALVKQILGENIVGQPISPEELQMVLEKLGSSKIIAPPYGTIRPLSVYGFITNTLNVNYGTNQNVINSNNNYNINMSRVPNTVQQINQITQQLQYNEKPILNEYNIQNELSTIRENLRKQIRLPNQIQPPTISINQLENYGKQMYYEVQNIQPQRNPTISRIRSLGKELLRPEQKLRSLERESEEESLLLPEMEIIAGEIYREETTKPIVTTETVTTTTTKPKTPGVPTIPPTTPPREFPPFGFPEITIMGQPIRGLASGLSRGVRTMYDIQYALSRLTL